MRPTSLVLLLAIAAAPATARGDAAVEEVSAGSTPQTATTPKSNWIADKIGGLWEPGERVQLRVDFTATRDYGIAPTAMPTADPTTDILLANFSAELDPDDHWSLKAIAGVSPSSTMYSGTTVPFTTARNIMVDANAALKATTSSASAGAMIAYDSGDDRDFESAVTVVANATHYDTQQSIVALQDKMGKSLDVGELVAYCAAHACTSQLNAALAGGASSLDQIVLEATFAETLFRHTDVGIDAAYYIYDKDPTTVGYFSLAAVGRSTSFGGGMNIAPLQYTVTPSVLERWGGLLAMASLSYGKYVDNDGFDISATLRVQYKFKLDRSKRLKLWGKVVGSRDVDQNKATSYAGSAALGAQFSW